jgi:hypothetical protein
VINSNQKGIAHILLILLIVIIIGAAVAYFIFPKLGINTPSLPGMKQEPKVEVKTEYQNPLKQETQYVNPFDQYKSHLVTLKKE